MEQHILKNIQHVHFIGIGGIGISAIARMFMLLGKKVSGSDMSESKVVTELRALGADIIIGHAAVNIPKNIELIIYTIAIPKDNEEFIEANKRKVPVYSYPESLHFISKDKYTIAVSGTHGKTTTTAMIAKIMIDAGLDPTVIVGSFLKDQKSNFVAGKSDYFVIEACEYQKSFLNIEPKIVVVTNIDNDHLDFYKDIYDIQNAFSEFVQKVPKNGYVIYDGKDALVEHAVKNTEGKLVLSNEFRDRDLKLKIPGNHILQNAEKALAVAHILGIDARKATKSLEDFSGTWRRFEYKGETKDGVVVYDDYGHHPTEIQATLKGSREFFGKKKIVVVFQPHLFSRTKLLIDDFAKSFVNADLVLVAPIYAAREKPDSSISSEILVGKIQGTKALSFHDFEEIENYLKDHIKEYDVIITMGAGDIYTIGEHILY